MNKNVQLTLSNNQKINFDVGHKSNSIICDFMNCDYSCKPNDIRYRYIRSRYTNL